MAEDFQCAIHRDTRLELLTLDDAPELFAVTDANRAHLRVWLPWVDGVEAVADSRAFIEQALAQHARDEGFHCAIKIEGRIAGVIGHDFIDRSNRIAQLGYWLAAPHQGRGLMTKACRALIDHAFGELDLNRVEIACAPDNHRSRAIPERLGFVYEATRREAERLYDRYVDNRYYGSLRAEWERSQ